MGLLSNKAALDAMRKYWSSRTWSSVDEALENITRRTREENERYGGIFAPTDLSLIEQLPFVTTKSGVRIKPPPKPPKPPIAILDEVTEGSVPPHDFGAKDLIHRGSSQSAFEKYGRGIGTHRQGYIHMDDLPTPKLAGGRSGYGWDEMAWPGEFPAITVRLNRNGSSTIMDGNHRVTYWKEQGHDYAPAFIIDERVKK